MRNPHKYRRTTLSLTDDFGDNDSLLSILYHSASRPHREHLLLPPPQPLQGTKSTPESVGNINPSANYYQTSYIPTHSHPLYNNYDNITSNASLVQSYPQLNQSLPNNLQFSYNYQPLSHPPITPLFQPLPQPQLQPLQQSLPNTIFTSNNTHNTTQTTSYDNTYVNNTANSTPTYGLSNNLAQSLPYNLSPYNLHSSLPLKLPSNDTNQIQYSNIIDTIEAHLSPKQPSLTYTRYTRTNTPSPKKLPKKPLGVMGLIFLGFFWVCGGMYGQEILASIAPPLFMFSAIIFIPLFYSFPISLMTAELATTYPENAGQVIYIRESFGKYFAWHNSFWMWILSIGDASVYPILTTYYVIKIFHPNSTMENDEALTSIIPGWNAKLFVAVPIILFIMFVNLSGLNFIVKFDIVLAVIALIPLFILMFYGVTDINWSILLNTDCNDSGSCNWALLYSWVMWLNSGYSDLGVLAGEVANPSKTFVTSILILIPVSIFTYAFPFVITLSWDPIRSNYSAGYFNTLATKYIGEWFQYVFIMGAAICLIGVYNGMIIAAQECLQYMIENFQDIHTLSTTTSTLSLLSEKKIKNAASVTLDRYYYRNKIIGWFFGNTGSHGTGVRRIWVIVNALASCLLIWLPYEQIIMGEMVLFSGMEILFCIAFLYLRIKKPEISRPYKIRFGWFGVILCVLCPIIAHGINLYLSLFLSKAWLLNLIFALCCILFGIMLEFTLKFICCSSIDNIDNFISEPNIGNPVFSINSNNNSPFIIPNRNNINENTASIICTHDNANNNYNDGFITTTTTITTVTDNKNNDNNTNNNINNNNENNNNDINNIKKVKRSKSNLHSSHSANNLSNIPNEKLSLINRNIKVLDNNPGYNIYNKHNTYHTMESSTTKTNPSSPVSDMSNLSFNLYHSLPLPNTTNYYQRKNSDNMDIYVDSEYDNKFYDSDQRNNY